MPEYQRHAFEKEWHDKVEEFIEENDLAFDSPKYFIKFCVNRYMERHSDSVTKEQMMRLFDEAAKSMSDSSDDV